METVKGEELNFRDQVKGVSKDPRKGEGGQRPGVKVRGQAGRPLHAGVCLSCSQSPWPPAPVSTAPGGRVLTHHVVGSRAGGALQDLVYLKQMTVQP